MSHGIFNYILDGFRRDIAVECTLHSKNGEEVHLRIHMVDSKKISAILRGIENASKEMFVSSSDKDCII